METKIKFIAGESYSRRSVCDHDCISYIKIVSRTEKMVTAEDSFGRVRRYKVKDYGDYEYISTGNYSMAGGWAAKDICKDEEPVEAPVTVKELADAFSTEELGFIGSMLREALTIPAEELPANCVPFRRKVA